MILEGLPQSIKEEDVGHHFSLTMPHIECLEVPSVFRDAYVLDRWLRYHCVGLQIRRELAQYHDITNLEDVRIIKDKKSGKLCAVASVIKSNVPQVSRVNSVSSVSQTFSLLPYSFNEIIPRYTSMEILHLMRIRKPRKSASRSVASETSETSN